MTREETIQMLKLLRTAYPHFYGKQSNAELADTVELWAEMFAEDDINIVKYALKSLITSHKGYPPCIADVKEKMDELMKAATKEPTDEELWQALKKAIAKSAYYSAEEFEKLPPIVQRYLGSCNVLRELAEESAGTLNSVIHGQFLKEIKEIRKSEENIAALPPELKQLITDKASEPERLMEEKI